MEGNGNLVCAVNGIYVGVQESERAKEGVAALLNDECYSAVVEFRCVSSEILWVKLKFAMVKL